MKNSRVLTDLLFIPLIWTCFYVKIGTIVVHAVSTAGSADTLEFAQILHRHGHKNPERFYPTDPYKTEEFWPGGFAQVTEKGLNQMAELGEFFRKRYGGTLISEKYDQYEVYVMSSDSERSIRSAMANLAALYDQDLGGPVPIRTILANQDNIIGNKKKCPKFDALIDDFLVNSEFMQPILEDNADLFEYINANSGLNITVLDKKLGYFHDTLVLEDEMDYVLPNWTQPIFNSPEIIDLIATSFTTKTHTPEFQRFTAGPMLGIMRDLLKTKTETIRLSSTQSSFTSDLFPRLLDIRRKLVIFSGHDTIMASLMNTLGVWEHIRAPFASALMLELYKNSTGGNYYLELWFRNDTTRDPYFLPLRSGSAADNNNRLSLEAFFRRIDPLIPLDWDEECNLSVNSNLQSKFRGDGDDTTWVSQFFVGLMLGACMMGFVPIIYLMIIQPNLNRKQNCRQKDEYISFQ